MAKKSWFRKILDVVWGPSKEEQEAEARKQAEARRRAEEARKERLRTEVARRKTPARPTPAPKVADYVDLLGRRGWLDNGNSNTFRHMYKTPREAYHYCIDLVDGAGVPSYLMTVTQGRDGNWRVYCNRES